MSERATEIQLWQARVAIVLLLGLVAGGALWYGVSAENLGRLWSDILNRPGGPMTFRFILQPAMALLMAFRDGVKDARLGRRPYIWALLRGVRGPEGRAGRLWEGVVATARILLLGVLIDFVYQWLEFKTFYPAQAAVIAVLLAFVPYALLRGPMERIALHWFAPPASG